MWEFVEYDSSVSYGSAVADYVSQEAAVVDGIACLMCCFIGD